MKVVMTVAILVSMTASGCFKGEENTCEYWGERLEKSAEIEVALRKVAELKCVDKMPVLEQMYSDGQFQDTILQSVKQMGDKKSSLGILKMGLKSSSYAKLSASIIKDWKLSETRDELLSLIKNDRFVEIRDVALDALLSFDEPKQHEELFLTLASNDANRQGHLVNARAIEELGKLGSVKGIPNMAKLALLRTNKGFEVFTQVRGALARIGPAALPELKKNFSNENKALQEFTRSIGVQDWEVYAGAKMTQLIADQLSPEAADILVKSMARELEPPAGLSDRAFQKWRTEQINRLKVVMSGLGTIGDDASVAPLAAIVTDRKADTINQRINASTALAMIGSPAAQDALMNAFTVERLEQFKDPLVQTIALAVGADKLTNFDQLVTGATGLVATRLADKKTSTYLSVVRECRKDEVCLMKKLKSDDTDAQVKAATLLARKGMGPDDKVLEALFEVFEGATKDKVDTKRFTLMALVRRGNAATADKLIALSDKIAKEGKEKDSGYWAGELLAYGHGLKHRLAAKK